jgi:hypothetical protein
MEEDKTNRAKRVMRVSALCSARTSDEEEKEDSPDGLASFLQLLTRIAGMVQDDNIAHQSFPYFFLCTSTNECADDVFFSF